MNGSGLLILIALLFVVFYVLAVRPQRQRQAQHQATVDGLGVGEDVLTTGGIYGTVTRAEGDDIVVEIADGVEVHMTRRGIAAVLPPEDEDEDLDDGAGEDEESPAVEADEEGVQGDEESVTEAVGEDSRTGDRR
jgi:preprotein translocase subunit YajC